MASLNEKPQDRHAFRQDFLLMMLDAAFAAGSGTANVMATLIRLSAMRKIFIIADQIWVRWMHEVREATYALRSRHRDL